MGSVSEPKTLQKKGGYKCAQGLQNGTPGEPKKETKSQKMGSGRHSKKRARTGCQITCPGTLKMTIIHSSVIKKQRFHPCPKTSKKPPKWVPKWSQNHLNSVPDAWLKKHKNRAWKSARIWAPRVPKPSPKMSQNRQKTDPGHPGVGGVSPGSRFLGFWLHFGFILASFWIKF